MQQAPAPPSAWTRFDPSRCDAGVRRELCALYESDVARDSVTAAAALPMPTRETGTVRVVSWNVHQWCDAQGNASRDRLEQRIVALDADVVCLQEATNVFRTHSRLGGTRGSFDSGAFTYTEGDMFTTVFCNQRRLVQQQQYSPPCYTQGEARSVVVTLDRTTDAAPPPLTIACVHFDVHDSTGEARRLQAKRVDQLIGARRRNVLVVGDFNAYDYDDNAWLREHDRARGVDCDSGAAQAGLSTLRDAGFVSVMTERPTYTVWSARTVDHALARSLDDWRVVDARALAVPGSDHLPLVVDLAPIGR